MSKQRKTSFQRKYNLLKSFDIDVLAMRPCFHCTRLTKACKIASESNKCFKCVRLNHVCNLIFFDIDRYRRFEKQRKKLKAKLHTTIVKQ